MTAMLPVPCCCSRSTLARKRGEFCNRGGFRTRRAGFFIPGKRVRTAGLAEDRLGQVRFVETAPGVPVGESTVDDDGWQAADPVTAGRHPNRGIVHVANFPITLRAPQKPR